MLTTKDLEDRYGRSVTAQELSNFLGVDRRTVIKYADRWGGVEVVPGRLRFFEKRIEEKLNAEFNREARQTPLASERTSKRDKPSKTIPGRYKDLKTASGAVGGRNKKPVGKGAPSRHGLLDTS